MPLSTAELSAAELSAADIEEELRVPEAVETPSGFYGARKTAVPVPPGPANSVAKDTVPERVGDRLTRRRMPQARRFSQKPLLIVAGIAGVALVGWLGVATASWLQRDRLTPAPLPTSVSELELPAQLEVALNQKDLDAATIAAQKLINQGKFAAAITALNTANRSQQTDVIVAFFKGRSQWGLAKQGSNDFSVTDAMRSWVTALEGEPDWMEISMALGFAQQAMGDDDLALESWQRAIDLAERQPAAENIYFSNQPASEYALNAYAGVAMAALSLSKIEADPAQRNLLIDQALAAYVQVLNEAPDDFRANSLGENWLWLGSAIADWSETKEELNQLLAE